MQSQTISPLIETTADGSPTLRHPLLGEAYHSLRGALGEAQHVFLEQGLQWWLARHKSPQVRVLEMGFGSGLNAWLTAIFSASSGIAVRYEAIELYPVAGEVAARLDYASDPLFSALHRVPWEKEVALNDRFTLKKRCVSLLDAPLEGPFDLVYFDAFAPDAQPELWSRAVFEKLYTALIPGGALATYSAKGTVKTNLRAAGFEVIRLPGALGKRHMLRAIKFA